MAFQGVGNSGQVNPLQLALAIRNQRMREQSDAVSAASASRAELRAEQSHRIDMLTKMVPLIDSLATETEAAGAQVDAIQSGKVPGRNEELRKAIQAAALREFGTTDVMGIASGAAGEGVEDFNDADRASVLEALLSEGRQTAGANIRDRAFAGVDERLETLSRTTGIPAEDLRKRVESRIATGAFDRNREFALREREQNSDFDRSARLPTSKVERAIDARDDAYSAVFRAKNDAERGRALDRLNTLQNNVNRLSGGENAIIESGKARGFAFKAARNVSDLRSMSQTIDAFDQLIEQNPQIAGVTGSVRDKLARVSEVTGALAEQTGLISFDAAGAVQQLLSDSDLSSEQRDRLERIPTDFDLQAFEDLRVFRDILALKVAQTSSPDRFAYALFERFANQFDFTGVQGPQGVRRKLRAVKSVVDSVANNTEANLRPSLDQPFFNPAERLALDAQLSGETQEFEPEAVQFDSIRRFQEGGGSKALELSDEELIRIFSGSQ